MIYAQRYIQSSLKIIKSYQGNIPLHVYLKKYFAANKKYGSKDRKQITSLCYNYFRLGYSTGNTSLEDRILIGTFLCENKRSEILENVNPEWNDLIEATLTEKISILHSTVSTNNIFPCQDELSKEIEIEKFNLSFLTQPDLFLRIRPGNNKKVTGKLAGSKLIYKSISQTCIALPNASKVNAVIELDKEAVVQDYNSQRVGEFIKLAISRVDMQEINVWDCCAASGGKSIMAYDIKPSINLTVSDNRKSILQNLQKRFAVAGIKNYDSFVADLSGSQVAPGRDAKTKLTDKNYDLIIADVPCTGSGTWARTPEQLYYSDQKQIKKYRDLQKQIVENAIPYLKPGGYLLYITCSVFKKENEEVAEFIKNELKMNLVIMQLLKGYQIKADTMFVALFIMSRSGRQSGPAE